MSRVNLRIGYCDGIFCRWVIKIGGIGLLGGLLLLYLLVMVDWVLLVMLVKVKVCIFLLFEGGLSYIDMWDLKFKVFSEICGPFNFIVTNVLGMLIGELMLCCAKVVDKFSMVCSAMFGDGLYQIGVHWILIGYLLNFVDG